MNRDVKVMKKYLVYRNRNNPNVNDFRLKNHRRSNLSTCSKMYYFYRNKMQIKERLLKVFNFLMKSLENNMINVLNIIINLSISSKKFSLPFNPKEKKYMLVKLCLELKEIYVNKPNKLKIE